MNRFVERYCAQVSKRLVASRRTRRRLLEGLTGEILERLGGKCSEEDIVLSFGSPEAVAAELQGCVPAEETGSTRSGWVNRHMILAAICVVLAVAVYFISWYGSTKYIRIANKEISYFGGESVEESIELCTGSDYFAVYRDVRVC